MKKEQLLDLTVCSLVRMRFGRSCEIPSGGTNTFRFAFYCLGPFNRGSCQTHTFAKIANVWACNCKTLLQHKDILLRAHLFQDLWPYGDAHLAEVGFAE
jgi:hypothetical protein